MRAIGASEKIAERQRRQDQLAERGAEGFEIAGDQAVDQIKAGDVRRRRGEGVEPSDRRRRPAELIIEDVDQQQAGEEHRQRHAGGRDNSAGMIDPRALFDRGQNAERHGDDDRQDQAEQGEFGGSRQAAGDFGRHRPAGRQRIAEIAMREIVDVAHELFRQRPVEAEAFADVGDRLRRCRRTGEIDRRVARQHAGQKKGDDHDPDQGRDHGQKPAAEGCEHGQDSSLVAGR